MEEIKKYTPGLFDATVREMRRQKDANIAMFNKPEYNLYLTRDILDAIDLPLIPIKSGGKIGFIDKMCNIVVDPIYDDIKGTFRSVNSFVAVKKGRKWSIINSDCHELMEYTYGTIKPGYETPITTIQNQKQSKVVNVLTGEVIVDGGYDYIGGFRYGFARVRVNDLWGIINDKGKLVVEPVYTDMFRFYEWHEPTTVVKTEDGQKWVIHLNLLDNSQNL